jgi:hypothetical protein
MGSFRFGVVVGAQKSDVDFTFHEVLFFINNVVTCRRCGSAWLSGDVLTGRCDTGVECQDLQRFKETVKSLNNRGRTNRQVWTGVGCQDLERFKGTVKC